AGLERDPNVLAVIPDRPVNALGKPDPDQEAQGKPSGGAPVTGQVLPIGVNHIGASTAWAAGLTGSGVGVAIIDTGIDFNHTDLQPVAALCYTAYTSCQDNNGHGTHVSGKVADR